MHCVVPLTLNDNGDMASDLVVEPHCAFDMRNADKL